MKKFKIPSVPPTTNKCIRFPNDIIEDIEKAIEILGTEKVSLLHCITSYPAPESEYNVKLIQNLHNIFGIETGVSDHSLDPILVPSLTAMCGGNVIEKHITLSRQTSGLDDPVALEPEQFAIMVHCIHQTEAVMRRYGSDKGQKITVNQLSESYGNDKVCEVLGDGVKKLAPSEKVNYGRTNRSLHFMRSMQKGEKIKAEDIAVLRTEKILSPGISPEWLSIVCGATLSRNVDNGAGIQFEDFVRGAD